MRVGLLFLACVALHTDGNAVELVGPDGGLRGSVEADEFEFTMDGRRLRSVEASGNVTLRHERAVLTADSVSYDFQSRSGELVNGRAQDRGIIFFGRRIRVDGDRYRLEEGGLTTCDKPKPDYLLSAREVEAIAGEEAIMRGASLRLYGKRIISLGRYHRSLRPGRKSPLPMPLPGYSRYDSVYVAGSRTVQLGRKPSFAAMDLVLSAKRGPRGTVALYQERPGTRAGVRMSRRAEVPDELLASLTLERLPEVFASGEWALSQPAGIRVAGGLMAGSYREWPSGRKASREDLSIGLRRVLAEGRPGAYGGLRYRKSWYSDDSRYEVWESELGVRSQPGRGSYGELAFIHRAPHGATPFEFDDVDIGNELRGRIELDVGRRWAVGAAVRYDTAAADVVDQMLSLTHRAHCLTYTVNWHELTGEFGLGVGLVGF